MKGTVYDKLRALQDHVKKELGYDNEKSLYEMTCKLSSWHYPKKRTKDMTINDKELKLYEFFINNDYNPSTVYKWMLACNTSDDILKKVKSGEIGLKKALSTAKPFKRLEQVEEEMMYRIKMSIKKYVVR